MLCVCKGATCVILFDFFCISGPIIALAEIEHCCEYFEPPGFRMRRGCLACGQQNHQNQTTPSASLPMHAKLMRKKYMSIKNTCLSGSYLIVRWSTSRTTHIPSSWCIRTRSRTQGTPSLSRRTVRSLSLRGSSASRSSRRTQVMNHDPF